ncbi:inositol monophosphatase family protein [Ignavigranum ruoffiae]|uniref:inositol monophosphatase family protein n=1 Tax=Ignavigranum ruoffiae TaxID=89093 RepID=UPI002356031F|nr:inositol monophosphatase family protein [Ignavigranum ruoffiae]
MDFLLHQRIGVWMKQAGQLLLESLNESLHIEEKKSPRDLVTEMDRLIERFFRDKMQTYYPSHRMIGEEETGKHLQSTQGYLWLLDPIDGTMNFIKQKDKFAIMLGIYKDGQALAGYIYDVIQDNYYYGLVGEGAYLNDVPLEPLPVSQLEDCLIAGNPFHFMNHEDAFFHIYRKSLGIRYYGSASFEIIGVLKGELGAYLSVGLQPWDFAAGYAICQALGFKVTTLDGLPPDILQASTMIFAPPLIHREIMSMVESTNK